MGLGFYLYCFEFMTLPLSVLSVKLKGNQVINGFLAKVTNAFHLYLLLYLAKHLVVLSENLYANVTVVF